MNSGSVGWVITGYRKYRGQHGADSRCEYKPAQGEISLNVFSLFLVLKEEAARQFAFVHYFHYVVIRARLNP